MGGRPALLDPLVAAGRPDAAPARCSKPPSGRAPPPSVTRRPARDSCRTATPTLRNLMVRLSRTGGDCLTAMPSPVGSAGSGTASARRLLGVAGCVGGSGVF
jgi:hypothetical protein